MLEQISLAVVFILRYMTHRGRFAEKTEGYWGLVKVGREETFFIFSDT